MDSANSSDRYHPILALFLLLGWLLATMLLWGFALYQVPDTAPEWLIRARAVCFGTGAHGLPDASGWLMLTLGPLSFLLALLVAMSSELRIGCQAALKTSGGKFILCALLIACLIEAGWVNKRVRAGMIVAQADYSPQVVNSLPEGYPRTKNAAVEFSLTDQHSKRVSLSNLGGKNIILTFAFAHCQTICPALVTNTRAALKNLPPNKNELLIITLDPWRDTPGSLPTLAKKWNLPSNARVLSGSVEEVTSVIKSYNIPSTRDEKTGDLSHPGIVYVLAADSTIAYTFNNPPAKWITEAVRRIDLADARRGHG